ncbi:MAG: Smr/MutS family protein [Treponema sp.]|jgi:DNA-nicking Smr family endonuclease|nr:Smr/MutS family protein [Treponema sp.]
MNFEDILNQWERQNAAGGKKAGAGEAVPEPAPQEKAGAMDIWLRRNGVYDKDATVEDDTRGAVERRRRLRAKKPDAELDIHGLTRDEAWEALQVFFDTARKEGLEKLLVIHGKGNHSSGEAVLKRTVREFIERCPFAGESGQAKAGAGGATWVLLKSG